jgi:glycosyltransferase involved in cell wall biosynthesis
VKISLVTPCFNASKTIRRTLSSVAAQGYPDLEYIVSDGGSRDGTLEIVEEFRHMIAHIDSRKDKNAADAVNRGFRVATGQIRGYINADDILMPGALARVAEAFRQHPEAGVITGGCLRVFADGTELATSVPDYFMRLMPLRNDIEQPSTFWTTAVHRHAGEFDDSFHLAFDWEWWNRLRRIGAKFVVLPDVLSTYYFSDTNLTSRGGAQVIKEMYRVTRRYGPGKGAIAEVYRTLFHAFDMRGYYDVPFSQLPARRQLLFGLCLRGLYGVFGREVISAYNWNWASKQVRGLKWY